MSSSSFVAYASPVVAQSFNECVEGSYFNLAFPEHSRTFVVDSLITDQMLPLLASDAVVTIATETTILEEGRDDSTRVFLATQPGIYTPGYSNAAYALDATRSELNGTPIVGTVDLGFDERGVTYGIDQGILTSSGWIPPGDGHVPVSVETKIFLNDALVLHKRFEESAMTTRIASPDSTVEFLLGDFEFSGSFSIQMRRSHTSKRLLGSIEYRDVDDLLVSEMQFTANIDNYGNVTGHLSPGSHINEVGAAAYVRGEWDCDTLTLELIDGTYVGECALLVPGLQGGLIGAIRVDYIED